MIKLLLTICCVTTTMIMVEAATDITDAYIDKILSNDRMVTSYFKCLMDTGKCSSDGLEIKRFLPEAIANKCAKCTDKQKSGSERIIKFMYEKKNDMWKQLEAKYDPQGIYRLRYKEEAKKLKINI